MRECENKTQIGKKTQASFIIRMTYNLLILVKWKTLWKLNVWRLGEKTTPKLFMCKQFSWSLNFHQKLNLYGKICTNFNGFRENVCVCFFWNPKTRERNQNILSILSGLISQNTTEGTRWKTGTSNFHCSVLQINTDCKTMEPQKLGGNRKLVVCEHVDWFMRLPIGPHTCKYCRDPPSRSFLLG